MKLFQTSIIALFTLLAISCTKSKPSAAEATKVVSSAIMVHPNGHYLQTSDGKPFFYLGDTGWELFHRLDREEAVLYLDARKNQGFNVIQAVLVAENNGINSPNAYGDTPLRKAEGYEPFTTAGADFTDSIMYDYWDHARYIVEEAGKRNLQVGLLPCWGEYVTPRFRDEIVFPNTLAGYRYGHFLGTSFKAYSNIIWILGGDRLPNELAHGIDTWRAMAEGITDATNGVYEPNGSAQYEATLMTYHCFYPSSMWFENDAWIDFHMWGSYHEKRDNDRAFEISYYQWQLRNMKPTLNGEPPYELSGINYDGNFTYGKFDDFDVRQQAYWSVFSGAMGHTYGCDLIWIFYNPIYHKLRPLLKGQIWKDQLQAPGARQMVHLKNLMESRPFFERVPAQDILAKNTHDATGHLQATKGANYAFVYIPTGKDISVVLGTTSGQQVTAQWFDPRTGTYTAIGTFNNSGIQTFNPPGTEARGNDWVLVLDSF